MRTCAFLTVVLSLGSACTQADPSGSPASASLSASASPAVEVTSGGTVDGFPIILTLRPRAQAVEGVTVFGEWVAWSEVSARPSGSPTPGTTPVPDRVVAYNTKTARTVVVARHDARAIPNLSTGTGDWLIDREITPRPAPDCAEASPLGCFTWRIWAVDLGTGREHPLAESSTAGPQSNNPIPTAHGDVVAWQEVDAKGAVTTYADRPAGGARRVLATGVSSSQLSITDDALFLDDGSTEPPRLLRVPVDGGKPEPVLTGLKFYRPRAAAGALTLVSGIPTEGMSVLLASSDSPSRRRTVFESNEIYNAWPLGSDAALVLDFLGLHRAQVGAKARHLSVEVVSQSNVVVEGGVLAVVGVDDSGASTIRLIDLRSAA